MSGEYIQNFIDEDSGELSMMASKLKNGFNKNEVTLISKNMKIKDFLKNFFNYLVNIVLSSNISCFLNL